MKYVTTMLLTSTTASALATPEQAMHRGPAEHFRRLVGVQILDRQSQDERGRHHHQCEPGERDENARHERIAGRTEHGTAGR